MPWSWDWDQRVFWRRWPGAANSNLVALVSKETEITAARRRLCAARLYGERVSLRQIAPAASGLPPYFASLIAFAPGSDLPSPAVLRKLYESLRPYGGRLIGPAGLLKIPEIATLPGARFQLHANGLAIIEREGALEGSTQLQR